MRTVQVVDGWTDADVEPDEAVTCNGCGAVVYANVTGAPFGWSSFVSDYVAEKPSRARPIVGAPPRHLCDATRLRRR